MPGSMKIRGIRGFFSPSGRLIHFPNAARNFRVRNKEIP
jgi:hypothetical protein